jgi:signal transduction histidine kinase
MARSYSISRRLTLMNMAVSGAALLLACAAFFTYDLVAFRDTMQRELSIRAQIVGANTISTLVFDDPQKAEATLTALEASPNILSGALYTLEGRSFATYTRPGADAGGPPPAIPAGQIQALAFDSSELRLARIIFVGGKPEGIVYLRSDLGELQARLKRYGLIVGIVLVVSLLAAWLISSLSRHAISEPIIQLADLAHRVSKEQNYSLRAAPTAKSGELETLMKSFNEMLGQIQERDAALQKAHNELEHRVEQRTEQLAAANKELEAFSYSVSHDLRAPLRHIDGFSSVLAQKYGPDLDPAAQQYLKRIREGAKHMGHLIDDLLNMARISRQEAVIRTTDANILIAGAIEGLKPECEGRRIDWRIAPLPPLDCDPGLMRVVFTNLLSNAVKYSRRSETAVIEVGLQENNGTPTVFVRDNGAGFDQEYAHKLFGVFQRLHRAEDFEGTGVGLATVRRIIEKHGGRIWAQGKVDEGATFFFTLRPEHEGEAHHE